MSEKKDIKLSIIVPVYNVEPYIRRALDSVIEQTYKNLEIILIDDGSIDNSGKICDEYAAKDSRVKVIHKENGGIVSAKKVAIRQVTGDYVINFDPDDWIESIAYENVVERINIYHPDVVAFGMTKEYATFMEQYPLEFTAGYYTAGEFWEMFNASVDKHLFFKQPLDMSQCDKAVRTELLRKHQLNCSDHLKKNEDDAIVLPCLLDMKDIYIDSGCWYHYCVRKTSILWENDEKDYEKYIYLAKGILEDVEKRKKDLLISKEFILYKLLHHLIMDIPEKLFYEDRCLIYPDMKAGSNIIVYGKGVFANRMMARIKEMNYCNIIDNVDSKDAERLKQLDESSYDHIVVAVFNSGIVSSILDVLKNLSIADEKVMIIDKNRMTKEILPEEIRESFETALDF